LNQISSDLGIPYAQCREVIDNIEEFVHNMIESNTYDSFKFPYFGKIQLNTKKLWIQKNGDLYYKMKKYGVKLDLSKKVRVVRKETELKNKLKQDDNKETNRVKRRNSSLDTGGTFNQGVL
jgi:predicted secreted protein